ncbi:hypothetical protein HDU81_000410 [Chytriomyces hyalinus]|nr:hypothetical protein HDU81_000410 [Chytriomyces hyalinus]
MLETLISTGINNTGLKIPSSAWGPKFRKQLASNIRYKFKDGAASWYFAGKDPEHQELAPTPGVGIR